LIALGSSLYGTTYQGGAACTTGYGTVFTVNTQHAERAIYPFGAAPDGNYPTAPLVSTLGIMFGTTFGGGDNSAGTIFSVTPAGKETILHLFGSGSDGNRPAAGLTREGQLLYGTTSGGGTYGGGTVYALSP
jgi:uncharacterized repeat protein (TIGR03803 family)